jgi:DNA-binding NarL/FixJ family response regulator
VAAQSLPDVIVMEVRLSDGSGIEATRDIRAARPQTRVLNADLPSPTTRPCVWPVR